MLSLSLFTLLVIIVQPLDTSAMAGSDQVTLPTELQAQILTALYESHDPLSGHDFLRGKHSAPYCPSILVDLIDIAMYKPMRNSFWRCLTFLQLPNITKAY